MVRVYGAYCIPSGVDSWFITSPHRCWDELDEYYKTVRALMEAGF